jgi:hypothetical protein
MLLLLLLLMMMINFALQYGTAELPSQHLSRLQLLSGDSNKCCLELPSQGTHKKKLVGDIQAQQSAGSKSAVKSLVLRLLNHWSATTAKATCLV